MVTNYWTASDKYVGSRVIYTNHTEHSDEYFFDTACTEAVSEAELKHMLFSNLLFVFDTANNTSALAIGWNMNGLKIAQVDSGAV